MKTYLILFFACLIFAAACKNAETNTPTAAFKAYIEAANKKDAAALKELFSKGSLKMLTETAQAQNAPLDEIILNQANPLSENMPLPESRTEKIEGANATLEIKNTKTAKWDKIYFTQEDGKWKIALDKFMEQMLKEINAPK